MNIAHLGRLLCAGLLALILSEMAPREAGAPSDQGDARGADTRADRVRDADPVAAPTPVAALSIERRTRRD